MLSKPNPRPGLRDIDYYMVGIAKLPGFDRVIKLSSNESPLGASPRALEAAAKALEDMHRYPEVDTERLQDALAARLVSSRRASPSVRAPTICWPAWCRPMPGRATR